MGWVVWWGAVQWCLYHAGQLLPPTPRVSCASCKVLRPHHCPHPYSHWQASITHRPLIPLILLFGRLLRLCRHMRLEAPDPEDWRYIERTMDRECRKLGGVGVHLAPGGDSLLLDFAALSKEE
jgi:hypothetical protein